MIRSQAALSTGKLIIGFPVAAKEVRMGPGEREDSVPSPPPPSTKEAQGLAEDGRLGSWLKPLAT